MKYTRLTKEQFEALNKEFSLFLAAQQITADDWDKLKKDNPDNAEIQLDSFSDLVWQDVLNKVAFVDKWEPNSLFLFAYLESEINLIAVKVLDKGIDLTTDAGVAWLQVNYKGDNVELYTASKKYTKEKDITVFETIKKGGVISDGKYYTFFKDML